MFQKIFVLIVASIICFYNSLFADSFSFLNKFSYSADVGLVSGSSTWSKASTVSTDSDRYRLGYQFTGRASYDISDVVSCYFGLGYKALNTEHYNASNTDSREYRMNYLYVPASLSVMLPIVWDNVSLNLVLGGYGAYLLDAESQLGVNALQKLDNNDLSSFDYGAIGGITFTYFSSVSFFHSINFSLTYDYGLQEIASKVTNNAITFSLATKI
tara:strand:- start:1048 stop:1689 length:642 start_codon:yes stop_codon:yes gene_type:complete